MPVSVRAKFKVISKTQRASGGSTNPDGSPVVYHDIELSTVYGDSPENKKFFSASPNGHIKLGTVNPAAAMALELNQEYYIDFTKAE